MKKTDLDIIYEDKNIIVVNKPSGLLTIATDKSNNTLYHNVSEYIKKNNYKNKIFIIHRLDKETSGVVMFAKCEKIKELYQKNWDNLVIKREYLALVDGITNDSGTIKSYLKENKALKVYSSNDPSGKLAITHYKKLKEKGNKTLLEIKIDTGRKNQIRVHMSDINHPIVGDKKYGGSNYKKLCLHASTLIIKNPITKKEMIFEAYIPNILK